MLEKEHLKDVKCTEAQVSRCLKQRGVLHDGFNLRPSPTR